MKPPWPGLRICETLGIGCIFIFTLAGLFFPSQFVFQSSTKAYADLSGIWSGNEPQYLPVGAKALINGELFELEVARTSKQVARGLMFRDFIPDNRGMLFIFEPASVARFWMKNVPVELDIIFLRDGFITYIASSVSPCEGIVCPIYGPESPVDRVLELRGGRAEELGLKVGGSIEVVFIGHCNGPE